MKRVVRLIEGVLCCGFILAACGGGGGGGGSVPAGGPTVPPGGGPAPSSIGSIVLSISGSPVIGVPGVFPLTVTVNDQNGKVISGSYPAPITLSDSDLSGTTTLSATTLSASGTALTLTYNGKSLASPAIISAAAKGLAPSAVTSAQFAPKPAAVSISAIAVSFAGFPIAGIPGSYPVTVQVKDQSNNVITGPYPQPITLSDSDRSGATALSVTTPLLSSNTVVALQYTGKLLSTPATISASAPGVAPSHITNAQFAPNSQDPRINGAAFTYARTDTTKSSSAPTTIATSTDTVSIKTGASFGGQSNLIDVHQVHAPINPPPGAGVSSILDSYLNYVIGSTTATLLETGFVQSEQSTGSRDSSRLTYAPGYTVDELPQNAGTSWNPLSGFTSSGTLTDSVSVTTSSEQGNVDGSYSDASSQSMTSGPPALFTFSTVVRGDGTFVQATGQAGMVSGINNQPYNSLTTYTTKPPASSNGATVIPLQVDCQTGAATWPSPAPTATSSPQCQDSSGKLVQSTSVRLKVPDWFPGGGPTLSPLDQALVVVNSSESIPGTCNVPASIAISAVDEHTKEQRLDTALGMVYSTQTDAYYAPNVGLVCTISTEDDASYDQYASGLLQYKIQITSVRGLTAFTLPNGAKNAFARMAGQSIAASAVREVHEVASEQIRRMRAQRHRRLH